MHTAPKKAHALENNTLCTNTQYLRYLLPTESGRAHNKKVADEYPLHLPAGNVLRQDLGLLGHCPPGMAIEMLHQEPSEGKLTFAQKICNQMFSPLRVVIEQVHGGSKRVRMVQNKLRVRGDWFRDTVMVAACGRNNLHVRSPH